MTIVEVMRKFPTERECIRHIETVRWGAGKPPICPKCKKAGTGRTRPDGRYNCTQCQFSYRATHGTIFHGTQVMLHKWFLLIASMLNAKKGVSSHQLARDCGLNQKTAWYMAMRVRMAMNEQGDLLKGIVEIDETYIGGRPRRKNDRTPKGGSTWSTKIPVVGMIERGGNVKAQPLDTVSKRNIEHFIHDHISVGSYLYSDKAPVYRSLSDRKIEHLRNFTDGDIHINHIEAFWAIVKRGFAGQFHWARRKYLDRYIAEFAYRFNRRRSQCTFYETIENALFITQVA